MGVDTSSALYLYVERRLWEKKDLATNRSLVNHLDSLARSAARASTSSTPSSLRNLVVLAFTVCNTNEDLRNLMSNPVANRLRKIVDYGFAVLWLKRSVRLLMRQGVQEFRSEQVCGSSFMHAPFTDRTSDLLNSTTLSGRRARATDQRFQHLDHQRPLSRANPQFREPSQACLSRSSAWTKRGHSNKLLSACRADCGDTLYRPATQR